MNEKLYGVIEYIISNNGKIEQFNFHVILCEVFGIKCRYFITEGWIGIKTEASPKGKSLSCESLEEFISIIKDVSKVYREGN